MNKLSSILFCCLLASIRLIAQCPVGEVQVTIDVHTDHSAYECYWELLPSGNACGTGTIFSGGNNLVGCNGGNQHNQNPGGYANYSIITEGPWCLTQNASYDIIYVDDWADGGISFDVNINGYTVYSGLTGSGDAPGTRLTFFASPPFTYDMKAQRVVTANYISQGNVNIVGEFINRGTDTISTLDFNYNIDNGTVVTSAINNLHIAPFTSATITHATPWVPVANSNYNVKIWADNLNGNSDMNSADDTASKIISVIPGIPNIIDGYIGITPLLTVIADTSDGVEVPRDLDFHPILERNELWVILKSTDAIGGKTVKISNAGKPGQTSLLQKDGNAYHFMSLPTGIAFSDNENFATSPGVFDANHDGGSPFTGPTLWSSDSTIYAQPSGGNGSHIDMLHQSPYSMGICHEADNAFWVFDGNAGEIVRYDFKQDHGPGNSDHSDGVIRRYTSPAVLAESTHHVPSHLILQKSTGMLFIVDTGHDRILRMDINTGSFTNNLTPYEPTAEYANYGGAVWNIFADSGLVQPSGIDLIEDRIIVSDFANGNIIIYDNSGATGVELGRIVTGTPGIMGVKIGPDGKIWYVNATTNQVIRIDGINVGINSVEANTTINIYPNPASDNMKVVLSGFKDNASGSIVSVTGSIIRNFSFLKGQSSMNLDLANLSQGIYLIRIYAADRIISKTFIKN